MQDPSPENIVGQKRVSHSVNWEINVGYALIGLAALYGGWKLFSLLSEPDGSTSEEDADADVAGQFGGLSQGAVSVPVE